MISRGVDYFDSDKRSPPWLWRPTFSERLAYIKQYGQPGWLNCSILEPHAETVGWTLWWTSFRRCCSSGGTGAVTDRRLGCTDTTDSLFRLCQERARTNDHNPELTGVWLDDSVSDLGTVRPVWWFWVIKRCRRRWWMCNGFTMNPQQMSMFLTRGLVCTCGRFKQW